MNSKDYGFTVPSIFGKNLLMDCGKFLDMDGEKGACISDKKDAPLNALILIYALGPSLLCYWTVVSATKNSSPEDYNTHHLPCNFP